MPAGPRREPKYAVIAADLQARIRSGEYPAGSPLPPQHSLSEAYGVTLMTLRQALQVLAGQGLIVHRAGKDTLVSPPSGYRLDTLRSLFKDLREQHREVTSGVVGSTALRNPPLWVAASFDTDRALRLERVRYVDGSPAVHQVSWVREPYGSAVRERDFRTDSLYDSLARVGVVVHRASETIGPEVLDSRVAGLLDRPAGIPVLASRRVTYGLDDAAVVVDRATILGGTMEIRAERTATEVSMLWAR